MILADTNIIIDFWKNPTHEQIEIFSNNEIAICHVIMIELILLWTNDKHFPMISRVIEDLKLLK